MKETFINEIGNRVTITTRFQLDVNDTNCNFKIEMKGPRSYCDWSMTKLEAEKLRNLLIATLNG